MTDSFLEYLDNHQGEYLPQPPSISDPPPINLDLRIETVRHIVDQVDITTLDQDIEFIRGLFASDRVITAILKHRNIPESVRQILSDVMWGHTLGWQDLKTLLKFYDECEVEKTVRRERIIELRKQIDQLNSELNSLQSE